MNIRVKKLIRRVGLVILLCIYTAAMAVTAFADGVSDEVKDYAKALAKESGASSSVVAVKRGSGSTQYATNQTTASNGRNLYVFELINAQSYGNQNSDMDFAIFWKTGDKVYYTYTEDNGTDHLQWDTHCQASHKTLAGQTSGESYWGLRGGKRDILTIVLPYTDDTTQFLGVYFHKTGYATKAAGKHAWSGESLKVARVNGTIDSIGIDGDGLRYVNYGPNTTAYYVAGRTNMTKCDYNCGTKALTSEAWGHALFKLNQLPLENANTSAHNSVFVLEMVAGETGYVDMKGNVTIHYTNGLGMKCQKVLDFDTAYEQNYPENDIIHINTDKKNYTVAYDYPLTGALSSLSDEYMGVLASAYAQNYYSSDVHDTLLRPYTATSLSFVMTQDIASIDKIVVTLNEGSKTMVMQSLRLIQASEFNGTNYFNGNYSMERTKSWKGYVIAQSRSIASIGAKSSFTYQGTSKSNGLDIYAYGEGLYLDNSGTTLGVSVHFADVLGGGIESMLAYNDEDPRVYWFLGEPALRIMIGSEQSRAYRNLAPFHPESITLEVTYKDTLGCTRKVQVPFVTTYILKMLLDNQGDLTGGSREQWIAGILQQNETAGITLRLAQYRELVGVRLFYGSGPEGFASVRITDSYDYGTVDTAKDPISVESICVYEGANDSNFRTVYDSYYKSCLLQTSLTPTYYWQSALESGQTLAGGGSITASRTGSGSSQLKAGSPKTWSTTNKYLVQMICSDVQTAGTSNPINITLTYTNTAGKQITTNVLSLPTLMGNFYGTNYRNAPSTYLYERHMRRGCAAEFIVELEDVATIDSMTLTLLGSNEYQFRKVSIYKLDGLSQRWAEQWNTNTDAENTMHLYWKRSFSTDKSLLMATCSQSVQLYKNANQKTIYFTTYDPDGNIAEPEQEEKENSYLTSLPSSLTYSQTLQNLGLSVVKYTYLVDVKVADSEDSGSTNYFYFQLQFANGSSAVVLANQQLMSDSFRAGKHESFSIKTTQNYGELVSVRIICDSTSSTSDVFDKLNIENITVTLQSSDISKTWEVENVGWIDITYVDEGADIELDGVTLSETQTLSNAQIVKEFPITKTAAAMELLFSITTASTSASDSTNTYKNALGGQFQAVLNYIDSDGMEQSKTLNLVDLIQSYNDSTRTSWLFRPNKTDRFVVSMTDISSIQSLIITRSGGKNNWVISSVTVQQVSGMSNTVYMSAMNEYWRNYDSAQELACSNNEVGSTYTISGDGTAMITFTENKIEMLLGDQDTWSTAISREPITRMETLNIYLFAGSVAGRDYKFSSSSPTVKATITYNNALAAPTQTSVILSNLGTIDGETVLYTKGLQIDGITTLTNMRLLSMGNTGDGPIIEKAIVQRVRNGVIVATYYIDFLNTDISVLPDGRTCTPSSYTASQPMHQTVTFQPSADQKLSLVAENYDVAVALRYTSTLDPSAEGSKTVYQSPYVYLTDADITTVLTGKNVIIPFEMPCVDEIMGICVVSTGPAVSFDNALIRNYSGTAGDTDILLSTVGLDQAIQVTTIPTVIHSDGKAVLPAVFTFTTAPKDMVSGAGTSGKVSMIVHYTDSDSTAQSMMISDILRFLDGESPLAGSTVQMPIMLSNVVSIQSVEIIADDGWFITELTVELTNPDGSTDIVSRQVNNWATGVQPLTIDLSENGTDSYIQSFGVSAVTSISGNMASALSGSILQIQAYAGEGIVLIPEIWAVGNPNKSWEWVVADSNALSIQADGSAVYHVPSGAAVGQTFVVEVVYGGDRRISVVISITVINPVPAAEAG